MTFTTDDPAKPRVEAEVRKFFAMSPKQRLENYGVEAPLTGYAIDVAIGQKLDLSRSTIRLFREEMYEHLDYEDKPWRDHVPDKPDTLQRQLATELERLHEEEFDFRGLMASSGVGREEIDRVINGDPIEPRLADAIAKTLDNLRAQTRGSCVRHIRDAIDLSGPKFARLIGVTPSTLSRWENGHSTPSAESLFALWERVEGLAFTEGNSRRALVALMRGSLKSLKPYLVE